MCADKMHADEADIDASVVRRLVAGQFPQWAELSLEKIRSSGTVNAMYRLGDELTVRLPLIKGGVDDVVKEYEWLPRFAPLVPVGIPEPVRLGAPAEGYQWPWSIYRWIDGTPPLAGAVEEPIGLARDLASFVTGFRQIDLPGGPPAYRGGPLRLQDTDTRKAIEELQGWIDADTALAAWEAALAAEPPASSVWVHGDLMPSNLLTVDGRLTAVIDFATAGVGDPACDLIPAWNLLPAEARPIYREALGVDDATWERGRGRALSMAVIQSPYYRETNEGIAANAQHVIDEVIADFRLH